MTRRWCVVTFCEGDYRHCRWYDTEVAAYAFASGVVTGASYYEGRSQALVLRPDGRLAEYDDWDDVTAEARALAEAAWAEGEAA